MSADNEHHQPRTFVDTWTADEACAYLRRCADWITTSDQQTAHDAEVINTLTADLDGLRAEVTRLETALAGAKDLNTRLVVQLDAERRRATI